MSTDTLTRMLTGLDESIAAYTLLDSYYRGQQALSFLSPEARTALGSRFARMTSNLPRLAVTSLAERLRVTGFSGVDVWDDWLRNDLDQTSGVVHREALTLTCSAVIVWADKTGRPKVTVESPRQVSVSCDPGSREVTAAVKRWESVDGTYAVLYEPDRISRYKAPRGASTTGYRLDGKVIDNPLGVVPVVPFVNGDQLLDGGHSEISDLIPLVDALNKLLADLMVSSEYFARPRRYATGIELEEADVLDADGQPTGETVEVNPFPEGHRMMISEEADAKFGQLPAGDLSGYGEAVKVLLGQIMAVSALPAHFVGVTTGNPATADANRSAEASLTARAEARQSTFGRSWERVAALMVAVRDGVDVETLAVRTQWADAATRSVAQEADAVVKLFSSGLLPATYALKRLGYSDDEVTEIRTARRAEALDQAGTDLTGLLA